MIGQTRPCTVRLLGEGDRPDVAQLLARDPVAAAQISERVELRGISAWRSGGRLYGYGPRGQLAGVCWRGASVVPMGQAAPFAEILIPDRSGISSLTGPAGSVLELWRHLEPCWGPAREVRAEQPLLVAGSDAAVAPDPAVRLVRRRELNALLPAAIAMYVEELGVRPAPVEYRRRFSALIQARRAYARIDRGEVIFKAELAVVTRRTAQLQGVWVAPEHRGRGLGTAGVAAVLADGLRRLAPTVSLYVNGHNHAARRAYARCGFQQVGTFATVLL